ncbi:deoxyribodipyrimidine photo-lyase [Holosporaceae bacterium 'Namur']|nr:deoxyribodipyrimidine photo-lyase [Holosporaceae bacterium 'Namur']
MSEKVAIVWFRNDLRILDNPALFHAYNNYDKVILLYIYDDQLGGSWKMGGASKWWLHHALFHLNKTLEHKNCRLILRKGDSLEQLKQILSSTKAQEILFNGMYEPYNIKLEQEMKILCDSLVVTATRFQGNLLLEPWEAKTTTGKNFSVFTPYWNACKKLINTKDPLPEPKFKPYYPEVAHCNLDDLNLLPAINWADGLKATWEPSEKKALELLGEFIDNRLSGYSELRSRPDMVGTSSLSPYLHFGQISVKYLYNNLRFLSYRKPALSTQVEKYLSEIGWREFAHHLLFFYPNLPEKNFRENFDKFQWNSDTELLRAWQRGMTGYPIVDAGMRQLRSIGWMHNRVRMIVASFLTKNLLISWQEGAKWFWDNLVDADLANNSASWQWVAGSGADAAPYFRIFNPVLQGEKFDPKGEYVRRWVPELKSLQNDVIHQPWKNFLSDKFNSSINYPQPIVKLDTSRTIALAAYKQIKS